jgi:hypothetical protein
MRSVSRQFLCGLSKCTCLRLLSFDSVLLLDTQVGKCGPGLNCFFFYSERLESMDTTCLTLAPDVGPDAFWERKFPLVVQG